MNRTRRLRKNHSIRKLIEENNLSINDLIYPIFIEEGENIKKEIVSMPGIYRYSIDCLSKELDEVLSLGIHSILLFGIPSNKEETGKASWDKEGIIQKGIKYIKKNYPDLYIITDVCFCEYTNHGHCGIIENNDVLNDKTLINIQKQALSHVKAGADMVAPSGMMDGTIEHIRSILDKEGFENTPIMGYSVKYSSAYYGPFRDAADSSPSFGNRKTYQMNPANRREAILEAKYDDVEGADILMVKPALSYLDIIRDLRNNFSKPIACYNVSGEYSMIKAAAQNGWIDEKKIILETLTSMKRAGADIIITYFAKEVAKILQNK